MCESAALSSTITTYLQVRGDYNVSVRISHYSNREHRLYNGRCCDPPISFFWGCLGDCDNYFVVCVGEGSEGVCRYTGEVGRSDSISFYSQIGDLTNPISFNINDTWTVSQCQSVSECVV